MLSILRILPPTGSHRPPPRPSARKLVCHDARAPAVPAPPVDRTPSWVPFSTAASPTVRKSSLRSSRFPRSVPSPSCAFCASLRLSIRSPFFLLFLRLFAAPDPFPLRLAPFVPLCGSRSVPLLLAPFVPSCGSPPVPRFPLPFVPLRGCPSVPSPSCGSCGSLRPTINVSLAALVAVA